MSLQSACGMSSESLLGTSVGRSVGRSAGCAGVGASVSQCVEKPAPRETPWPEIPPDTLGHRCSDEPGHQVEAQSAEGRRSHLRSVADLGSFEGRMGSSGGAHAEVRTAVYGAGRTMGIEAPTCPRATKLARILPIMLQGRNGWTLGHRQPQQGNGQLGTTWPSGRPQLIISAERFSDSERLQMTLQAYLPKFSDEQISVVQERVLQTEWYHNQGKYQGPVPETMPGESSAAPSRSLTTAAGIWTAEPPPIKGRIASSGTPVAKEKATSSGTPVAKEKATSSATPVAKEKTTAQSKGQCRQGRPWNARRRSYDSARGPILSGWHGGVQLRWRAPDPWIRWRHRF